MSKTSKAVILAVDDQPANLLVLEHLLDAEDRVLMKATNGNDALQIALNKNIDLIILDVQMPVMDGFEVAQILKLNKRTKDIPIIFATAVSKEHKFMMKGYEEGAVDYLYKPLDPEVVKAKVAVLLKLQLQKKELVEKNEALQKSALLINNSADIIGIIDTATLYIEEINKAFAAILGYTQEEATNAPLPFFLTDDSRKLVEQLSKETKEQLSFETGIYCKDRTIKCLQWKVVVKDKKWFFNARDITEQKKAEDRIRQMNEELEKKVEEKTKDLKRLNLRLKKRAAALKASNIELERFAFVASHDLQEPLRMVSSFLSLLEAETEGQLNEDAKVYINFAVDGAHRMKKLIQALLEYSRVGSGKEVVTDVDCNSVVANVRGLFELGIQESNATVIVHP